MFDKSLNNLNFSNSMNPSIYPTRLTHTKEDTTKTEPHVESTKPKVKSLEIQNKNYTPIYDQSILNDETCD